MKAIAINGRPDLPDAFQTEEQGCPEPLAGDLLVRIKAISVNPVDTKIRRMGSRTGVIGWDAVGIIEAIGDQVSHFSVGDCVYYAGELNRTGCNAEYQCVDARLVAKAPGTLEIEEIAALPLTSLTAWEGLFDVLPLQPNATSTASNTTDNVASPEGTLLVINGAGGVGSMVVQLAKQLTNLRVIATASRDLSRLWCQELGADLVVDHHHLVEELKHKGIETVDYIYCCHDIADHWDNMVTLIRPFGHIVAIAETQREVDINALQSKAASFAWEFMFARTLHDYHPEHQGQILDRIASLVDNGNLKSTLSEVIGPLSVETLSEAHRRLEEGHVVGKLVLTI